MKTFKANKIAVNDRALQNLNKIIELVRKDFSHVKSNASLLTSSIIDYFAEEFSEKHLEFLGQKLFNKSAYMKSLGSSDMSMSRVVGGLVDHSDKEILIDKKNKHKIKFVDKETIK